MSDMQNVIVTTLAGMLERANALVTRLNKPDDRGMLVHDYRVTAPTADETILKFREYSDKINQLLLDAETKVDEHIVATYLNDEDDDFDPDTAKADYAKLKAEINGVYKAAANLPGVDVDSVKESVPALLTLRGKAAGAKTGGGGKRPRVERIWVDGQVVEKEVERKNGPSYMSSNFSLAATYLSKATGSKVEVKDLQAAAFDTAGTDDLSELDGKVVEFDFSVGDKSHTIRVQPAAAKSSSDTARASTEEDDDQSDEDYEPTDEEIMAAANDDD